MNTLICIGCNAENAALSQYCANCGRSLADVRDAAKQHGEAIKIAAKLVLEEGSLQRARGRIELELEAVRGEARRLLSESTKTISLSQLRTSEDARLQIAAAMRRIGVPAQRETVTALEAYRIQYELNCMVTFGGASWNARQVSILMDSFGVAESARTKFYEFYNSNYRASLAGPLKGRIWYGLLGLGVIVAVGIMPSGLTTLSQLTLITCAAAIAYACVRADRINTHWDGYYEGFTDGKRAGVSNALQMTNDELQDQAERAKEMEIFEGQFPEFAQQWSV